MTGAAVALRSATQADTALLADLNQRLIADEHNRNRMDHAALEARFAQRLAEGWAADLILVDGTVAGYALHRMVADAAEPAGPTVQLRHFYVGHAWRRRGVGRQAIALLAADRWHQARRLTADVLDTNPEGEAFWVALGFVPYAKTLERSLAGGFTDRR